jgi:hypothetical protein
MKANKTPTASVNQIRFSVSSIMAVALVYHHASTAGGRSLKSEPGINVIFN